MNYPNYVEMSFKSAIKAFPWLFEKLPRNLVFECLADDKYICRISKNGFIEIGYSSDEWNIH